MAEEGVFVHQFELGPWDNFIYFIGDKATRTCAVVDPAWDADVILSEAEKLGVDITHVLCTHSHFDHVNRVDALAETLDVVLGQVEAATCSRSGRTSRGNGPDPRPRPFSTAT